MRRPQVGDGYGELSVDRQRIAADCAEYMRLDAGLQCTIVQCIGIGGRDAVPALILTEQRRVIPVVM